MINKQVIQSIISKYYLNGLVETVKWDIKDEKLKIDFISPVKDMIGKIEYNSFKLNDTSFAIYNTSQLNKLLSTTVGELILEIKEHKLNISDSQYAITYALADVLLVPKTANVDEPDKYDIELDLTDEHIHALIKAKGAVHDTDHVLIQNGLSVDNEPTLEFIIGDDIEHSNKITYSIITNQPIKINLPFNINYIKDILNANKDLNGKMFINKDGLMKIEFTSEDISSVYFIIRKSEV
jgi:hypothetical protein